MYCLLRDASWYVQHSDNDALSLNPVTSPVT